jgi:hypothetical protein
MRNRSVFALFVLASLVLTTTSAVACSCIGPGSPLEELAERDAVFSGRVLAITMVNEYDLQAHVMVYSSWKGSPSGVIAVQTSIESSMCGYFFEVGGEYLIYANDITDSDALWTDNCQRTNRLSLADSDLTELGSPSVVSAQDLEWGMLKSSYR